MSDWETALQKGLPRDQARGVSLALADAALAAKIAHTGAARPRSTASELRKQPFVGPMHFKRLAEKEQSLAAFKISERLAPTLQQRDEARRHRVELLVAAVLRQAPPARPCPQAL